MRSRVAEQGHRCRAGTSSEPMCEVAPFWTQLTCRAQYGHGPLYSTCPYPGKRGEPPLSDLTCLVAIQALAPVTAAADSPNTMAP
jgi:hypothetical protein